MIPNINGFFCTKMSSIHKFLLCWEKGENATEILETYLNHFINLLMYLTDLVLIALALKFALWIF